MKDSPKTRPTWRVATVSAVAALLVAGATVVTIEALAEGPGGPPGSEMHGGMGGMHGPMEMHEMKKRLDALQSKLALNPQQTALWTQATALMQPPPPEQRGKHKEMHDKVLASLKDDSFDPHQWTGEMEAMRAAREAKGKQMRDAWLAVWDSLNPAQKTQVRQFLLERASFMERMRAHLRSHHHEDHPGGPSASGPAPKS